MLHLPASGIEHPERVFAALALAMRYGGDADMPELVNVRGMLDERQIQDATVLGLALRLAYSLSGATATLLRRTGLRVESKGITLLLPKGGSVMFGEAVQRRLEALGRALDIRTDTAESSD
jgi:exopolyphosphatase/guanosine-5'-triphosphate,3'-diphosphate pyrophosphatase